MHRYDRTAAARRYHPVVQLSFCALVIEIGLEEFGPAPGIHSGDVFEIPEAVVVKILLHVFDFMEQRNAQQKSKKSIPTQKLPL